jgi:hypothetical protein
MGLVLGALGGVGEAAQNIGATMMKSDLDLQNRLTVGQQDNDLTLQRAKALEEFKTAAANQQRQNMARQIGDVQQQVLNEGVVGKAIAARTANLPAYDPTDQGATPSFHGDARQALAAIQALPDGPDKQAALAQLQQQLADNKGRVGAMTLDDLTPEERARFAPTSSERDAAFVEGAKRTGYIEPKDVLANSTRAEIASVTAQAQRDVAEAKVEAANARTQAQYDAAMAKVDAALARVQASAGGKPPAGYRLKADGSGDLEFIPGGPADPENKNKPLPASTAKGLLENQDNLRRAQRALALANGETVDGIRGDSAATGKKGWVPNQALNRLDPEGVDTRAAIADIGSMTIHDRSGAAVSASEFPRLQPFVPSEKDDADTVRRKLRLFVTNYQALVDDQVNFFRESGYKVPAEVLKSGSPTGKPTAPSSAQTAIEEEMRKRGLLK